MSDHTPEQLRALADRLRAVSCGSLEFDAVDEAEAYLRAQADAEPDHTLSYAKSLAEAIHAKHWPEVTQWRPMRDTLGLLTQIDNMTCRLVRPMGSEPDTNAPPPAEPAAPTEGDQFWLWRNGDHFLAFRNLYPCYSPGGDPMTLGEPIGRAIFKHSHNREGMPNEQQQTDRQSPRGGADSDLQRRHAASAGQAHAAGASASLGCGEHQAAPQGGWSAGNDGTGSEQVPDLARAAGVLAAGWNVAQGVAAEPGELPPLPAHPGGPPLCHWSPREQRAIFDYARLALATSPLPKERVERVMSSLNGRAFREAVEHVRAILEERS